jgi:hypothetical protein
MQLKDIKVGMKVKIPNKLSRHLTIVQIDNLKAKYNTSDETKLVKAMVDTLVGNDKQDCLYVGTADLKFIGLFVNTNQHDFDNMWIYLPQDLEPYTE